MKKKQIKDLMVPLDEYATVFEEASLADAIMALERAQQASQVLFGGEISGLSAADIEEIFVDVPSSDLPASELASPGMNIVDLLSTIGPTASKGEARRLIKEGGANLNNQRVSDAAQSVTMEDTIEGKFLVLRKGRKNYRLVSVRG